MPGGRLVFAFLVSLAIGCSQAPSGSGREPEQSSTSSQERRAPTADVWRRKADMNIVRQVFTRVALPGDRVLAIGGFTGHGFTSGNTAEIYQRSTDTWTYAAPVPRAHAGAAGAAVPLPSGQILYFGGFGAGRPTRGQVVDPEDKLTFLFDPKSNSWRTLASQLPYDFYGVPNSNCVLTAGTVVCGGGASDDTFNYRGPGSTATARSIVFDLQRETWSKAGSDLNDARDGARLIKLDDDRVFVSGGRQIFFTNDGHERYLASTEFYSPVTRRWTLGPPMPIVPEEDGPGCVDPKLGACHTLDPGARWGHVAHPLGDGRILIAGGNFNSDQAGYFWGARKSAFIFDPDNRRHPWRRVADLPEPRAMSLSSDLPDDRGVLVAFGQTAALPTTNPDCAGLVLDLGTSVIFDLRTEAWTQTASTAATEPPLIDYLSQDDLDYCGLAGTPADYRVPASSTYNNQNGAIRFRDGGLLFSGGFTNDFTSDSPFSAQTFVFTPGSEGRDQ
jgi:hypothetical protein